VIEICNQVKNAKVLNKYFSNGNIQMANRYVIRCLTTLIFSEAIKTKKCYKFPCNDYYPKPANTFGQECEKLEFLHSFGGSEKCYRLYEEQQEVFYKILK
jgi:hypothetical protein